VALGDVGGIDVRNDQYVVPFAAAWIVFAIAGTIALALLKDPSVKRLVQRALVTCGALLFVAAVWLFDGSPKNLLFVGPGVALIVLANFFLVRVCDSCAALIQPRNFVPPKYCSKCGAPLR
jgi:hypothetical protein